MRGVPLLGVMVWILCGCAAVTPHASIPAPHPQAWPEELSQAAPPDAQFLAAFGSDELNGWVEEALRNNASLDATEARIRAADAHVREVGSALLPAVAVGGAVNRVQGTGGGVSATEVDRGVTFSASFEPDFWGAAAAARRAARADLTASRADAALVRLTLKAAVTETVIDLLALRAQRATLQQRLEVAQQAVALLDARHTAGLLSSMDVMPYRAAVSTLRAASAPLDAKEAELSAALALLVGRDSPVSLSTGAQLRALTVPPRVGSAPADLLLRRPDLLAAESALTAAEANLDVARAAFFPRVTLDMMAGRQNPGFQAVLTTLGGSGNSWSLGAALTQTLFDGGRREAVRAQAQAYRDQVVANYRQSIRGALLDAQRAFAVLNAATQQRARSDQALAQLVAQEQAARARRQSGAMDPMVLLDAQQARWQAEELADAAYAAELKASVGVFKALGGGWKSEAMQ